LRVFVALDIPEEVRRRIAEFGVQEVIAVFLLLRHFRLSRCFDGHHPHRLVLVGVRNRNPDTDYLGACGKILHDQGIGEANGAGRRTELLLLWHGRLGNAQRHGNHGQKRQQHA
jgi:hypothetical protein